MTINNLEEITINGSEQWILVRGKSANNSLIIHVQAGPGLPIIHEANTLEKLLHLEDDYLVAYWDQRGCGKSYNKKIDPKSINFSQLTDDVIKCTQFLLEKYKKSKAVIIGYSIGATISLLAGAKNSDIFDCLFLVGIDVDIQTANKFAVDYAKTKAMDTGNKKFTKRAHNLCKISINTSSQFQKRAKLLTDLGGIRIGITYNYLLATTILSMLGSKEYSFKDIPKTIKGMGFCQDALLPELNTLNLYDKIKKIKVPVHFVQGKHDGISPYQTAFEFYEYIQAEIKTFNCFDNSAHMPQYDEPFLFANLIKNTLKIEP